MQQVTPPDANDTRLTAAHSGKPPRAERPKADPAPSRWAYRLHRLWLTPVFRKLVRVGVPFALALIVGTLYLSDGDRRAAIQLFIAEVRDEIHNRPEFMVKLMAIDGASTETSEDIREILPVDFPVSSFDIDLEEMRQEVLALSAVKEVSLRIRNGGVLQVDVSERQPVALWRNAEGLDLIDAEGVMLAPVETRAVRPDLPLIAGRGAQSRVGEALALFAAARPLKDRVRGLVRVGNRRWDVVLDRGQRIMLPEADPVPALERVIALSNAQDMLARDLVAVDMRLSRRPTIRMNKEAVENWWKIREISVGNN
ncbi:cell division protein FtsQ/DivIB [Rhodalgimonas zhirmunskyi]|uniref:Cell division protein FtsQ n=1 Tax=Rhodalgimonas zhirmunskyi TaxID=2964767 RepID=A0AAJ1UG08_9RHOB|nr:cell division protein FtsQ/DivIB [Rhodoalgimonas zhirmunskyi]MDQ2095457.1 cell division protein FtsQ/DivIB [Rhodoalgimonas zhirmunskyi]